MYAPEMKSAGATADAKSNASRRFWCERASSAMPVGTAIKRSESERHKMAPPTAAPAPSAAQRVSRRTPSSASTMSATISATPGSEKSVIAYARSGDKITVNSDANATTFLAYLRRRSVSIVTPAVAANSIGPARPMNGTPSPAVRPIA